jgi:pseudouridine synthase
MRLHVYLAKAGIASRRQAEQLIKQGEVAVNGRIVTDMGVQVESSQAEVVYRGKPVELEQASVLIAWHKPAGVLSTMKRGREKGVTIAEAVDWPTRLFPVGRLDRDTEGLMLLTNDGDLAQKLSHPRYEHEKEYELTLMAVPTVEQIQRLGQPFVIAGYETRPAQVSRIRTKAIHIILKEGRKRQIREMCRQTDLAIKKLLRVRIGPYQLGDLPSGRWRVIKPATKPE